MSPGAHLLLSWLSTVELLKHRRERVLVALSGVTPDLDGLGLLVDKATGSTAYYHEYHHYLGHNILLALIVATLTSWLAKTQRAVVWGLSFIVLHLHYLCDIVGSKGPDGYQWPIYYFYPFDSHYSISWSGQWELNAWQNLVFIMLLFIMCIYYAAKKKITFLEIFSLRLQNEALNMYRKYIYRKN